MEWNGMGMPEMMQMKGLSVCLVGKKSQVGRQLTG
jgi:hypothetical protein